MKNILSIKCFLIWTGAVVLLISSCQTVEFPEPKETGSSTPQFLFEGTAGGNTLNWAAGQSNYFMEATTEKDQNGVYIFRGHLKEEGCSGTCANSLMISVRDVGIATSTVPVNINDALKNGTVQLANTNTMDSVQVKITERPQNGSSITNIEIGGLPQDINDQGVYKVPADRNANIKITAAHNEDMFSYQLSQPLFDSNKNLRLKIGLKTNNKVLKITLNPTPPSEVKTVEWQDGSDGKNFEIDELPKDRITATVIYKNGQEAKFVLTLNDKFSFEKFNEGITLGFNYESSLLPASNPKMLNTVLINYFDENGEKYTSLNANQVNSNIFRIEESENFKENQQGQKTKKVKFELNLNVINMAGEEINLNGSGIFALAYPS